MLRLYHLGERDFWYDEAFTGVLVKANVQSMMDMAIRDVHPPLYYLGLKTFTLLAGTSVYAIRLYSVIFGTLTIWAVYVLTKTVASKRAGLFAAGVMAVAPFAIQYSQEARMYTQLSFLVVLATYCYWQWWQNRQRRYVIWWGVLIGLAALTHYFGIIYLVLFGLHAAGTYVIRGLRQKTDWRTNLRVLLWLLVGAVIAAVVFAPWIPKFLEQYHRTRYGLGWIPAAQPFDILRALQVFIVGSWPGNLALGVAPANAIRWMSASFATVSVSVLVVAMTAWLMIRVRRSVSLVVWLGYGALGFVYYLSTTGRQYFVPRFLSTVACFLFILAGVWLSRLRLRLSLIVYGLVVVFLVSVVRPVSPPAWNSLQADQGSYPNAIWYVVNGLDYVTAKYYLGSGRLVLFNADNPDDDPSSWAAIGPSLHRVVDAQDIAANPQAIIVTANDLRDSGARPPSWGTVALDQIHQYQTLRLFRPQESPTVN